VSNGLHSNYRMLSIATQPTLRGGAMPWFLVDFPAFARSSVRHG